METKYETYKPITLTKKIVGHSLIGIGLITSPLPTGSIFLVMAGAGLLSIDYKKLLKTIKFYVRETCNWFYAHRSMSRVKKAIKRRLL